MSIVLWIILGLVAGLIASYLTKSSEHSVISDIILGIFGAFLGGVIMNLIGAQGITGLNWYSLLIAVIGAIILIAIGRAINPNAQD
jgi:uncharacterized membrane protein YeaQ/YmgE (transglycosylase-associated protein family)